MSDQFPASGVVVESVPSVDTDDILTPDALTFLASLHRSVDARRRTLLAEREPRRLQLASQPIGSSLTFPRPVAESDWQVAATPADLMDRRVEITGPVERKMMINALNSGAKVFMADLEDSCSPTWSNIIEGQRNLKDAVRRAISLDAGGKQYRLNDRIATLLVRPRGWHLVERHITVDGEPMSASLVDFGLYFFHNAAELIARGTGPYFYLPKLEHSAEARLWNDVFLHAQQSLGIPRGTIRATVLIETLPAAFEMENILYELHEHASGLNAGRWDYLFSFIKTFRDRADKLLPDRSQLTMTVPFMRAYTQRLVQVCHRHGAHAIGGMAAFIPSRRDAEVNERAFAKVREDKERESGMGFDGTWVAHPDLVPVAGAAFAAVLGERPHQKSVLNEAVQVAAGQLTDATVPGGMVTDGGVRTNVDVALRYLDAWLRGNGAAAIHNLMEDAATAEISRSQLWQWIRHGAGIDGGGEMSREYYQQVRAETLDALKSEATSDARFAEAAALLDTLVLGEWEDFLTTPGSRVLEA